MPGVGKKVSILLTYFLTGRFDLPVLEFNIGKGGLFMNKNTF